MIETRVRRSVLCMLILLTGGLSLANEVTVLNDSFESGGSAVIVGNFVAGERAAVVLTSPCDGNIVAVQIGWLAGGAADPTVERFIHIYEDDGSFPSPGPALLTLDAPLLTPGFLNEFRYTDENNTVPIEVPVVTNQKFYVALEFENPTDVLGGTPSVFRDTNGCKAGKNALFAIPGGWLNFCSFLQGDLVIRAVIDCGAAPTGACCKTDGSCVVVTSAECGSLGGTYQGNGVTCGQANCPQPSGACCKPDGTCVETTPANCSALGGTYQGNNTTCGGVNCPQPTGACCFPSTGGCLNNLTSAQCTGAGGVWQGPSTTCGTIVCFPRGACCLPDGSCVDDVSPEECEALSGLFQGDDTTCATTNCPEPVGACCFGGGAFCLDLTQGDCGIAGGTWIGPATDCLDNDQNGVADDCEAGPCVACDTNCDGSVNGFDVDPFVGLLTGAGTPCAPCSGDVDGDGSVNGFDVDPFVVVLTVGGKC
ncbi:MAG: hypothetical protein CHACPFDD_00362 [Phycisphaerae bacterium]|nr:hypothetical protein [Phycisphaerae bacterium]